MPDTDQRESQEGSLGSEGYLQIRRQNASAARYHPNVKYDCTVPYCPKPRPNSASSHGKALRWQLAGIEAMRLHTASLVTLSMCCLEGNLHTPAFFPYSASKRLAFTQQSCTFYNSSVSPKICPYRDNCFCQLSYSPPPLVSEALYIVRGPT